MRGVNLLLVLVVGVLFLQFVSSVTELPGYADIYVNSSGERYGFKYLWTQNYSGTRDEFGGIVVENDIGYTVSKNSTGNITAFNATTGALIWTTYIGESDGTPLLDNQGDYIYINPGYSGPISAVYKLNKTSGAILVNNTICTLNMDSLAQSDYLVFQGCMDGNVYAYNKNDLQLNWTYSNPDFIRVTMTPLYYEGSLIVGGTVGIAGTNANETKNNTISLNATTGEVRWASNLTYNDFWDTQPSAEDGIVYISGQAGYGTTGFLYAFNNTDGVPIWNFSVGTFSQVALWEDRMVIINKGTVSVNATIFVVNKSNGAEICRFGNFGARIYQGASVVNGIGFFGYAQYAKGLFGFNLTNCDLIYKNDLVSSIYNPPAIARGKLYVKDDSKRLYAFDLGTGTGDWKYLGYDSTGRSSCTDCVTNLKYVKANCTGNDSAYNCTLKNTYDGLVYANLINSTGYNYTIAMTSLEQVSLAYNSSGFFILSKGFAVGDGSVGNPYQVGSWVTLNQTRNNLTANYILMKNLSSTDSDYAGIGDNWQPIAGYVGNGFEGNFYGNNNTISNIVVNLPSTDYASLFGYTTGNISDLKLLEVNISGKDYVGGLTGESDIGTISGCFVSGVVNGSEEVGGLVGSLYGSVSESYSNASVSGLDGVGGLVGTIYYSAGWGDGVVQKSYSYGSIYGDIHVGGLVGIQYEDTLVNNSYSRANVTGSTLGDGYLGGLVGYLESGSISNSYSIGYITGGLLTQQEYVGSLVGFNFTGIISNSYWDNQTSGVSSNSSGFGKTTSEMKNWTMYSDAGWDFTNVWARSGEIDYPRLSWEIFTFTGSAPVIHLFDITSSTSTSRNFIFNVSDNSDIANCTLYLNSLTASNSSAVNKSSNNTISYSGLDKGSYSAYVNCTDSFGFVGKSNVVSFHVLTEEVTSGGYSGPISKTLSDSILSNGFTSNFRKSDSLKFNVSNQTHTLVVNNISNISISITIQSVPQTLVLKLGDIIYVDVNYDGVKDVEVSYLKYLTSVVSLKIKSIYLPYELPKNETKNETVPAPFGLEDEETTQNLFEDKSNSNFIGWVVLVLAILIALFLLIRYLRTSSRERRLMHSIHYTSRFG